MADYPAISSDGHVLEPIELYERLPEKFRSRVPHIELIDGVKYRITEGRAPQKADQDAEVGSMATTSTVGKDGEARAGGWDPAYRVQAQEQDGITGEVIYPNDQHKFDEFSPDPEFQLALARTYNDWIAEVYGSYPDRFAPCALIPVKDIAGAVAEVQRVAKMGMRALFLPCIPGNVPYNSPVYEPLWSAITEVELPATFHAGSGHDNVLEKGGGGMIINYWRAVECGQIVTAYLAASGVLMRFPKLHAVMAECGAGWLAWHMNTLDESYYSHQDSVRPKLAEPPSFYLRRQAHVTFQHDPIGVQARHSTGLDCLLWGNDYPHPEGTWPYSRQAIADEFQGVPEEEIRQILFENPAKLYGFDKYLDKTGMPKSTVASR